MRGPLITLLTDFGSASTYVGQLKGRLLTELPDARLVDLSHEIRPQDVAAAARHLAECVPWFPPETIHVAVVDPGVGTSRELLLVRAGGAYLLAPDNGLLARTLRRHPPEFVRALDAERVATGRVSSTFHARDLLAPAVVRLARGELLDGFSRVVESWVESPDEPPRREGDRLLGCVDAIDSFGNVVTNIDIAELKSFASGSTVFASLRVACRDLQADRFVRTYGEVPPGTLVALVGSSGLLELAVSCGDAARRGSVQVGDLVVVTRDKS